MEDKIFTFDNFNENEKPKRLKHNAIKSNIGKNRKNSIPKSPDALKSKVSNLSKIKEQLNKFEKNIPIVEESLKEENPIIQDIPVEDKAEINDSFYTLYNDKSEIFSCDIYVEGAKTDDTITRLIIESETWTLMFPGEIKNGKCVIPIRKLNLFDEGQIGNIRLEVIAEGSVFIPWQNEFKVKTSKKVSATVNEKKYIKKIYKPEVKISNIKK